MSISTKLGDEFLRIPKLDVSGSNWVIFKDRFVWALDARCILNHIDGSSEEPADPILEEDRKKALSAEQKTLDTEWKKEMKEWKQGEAIAKQQIASSIPDSLFMKVRSKGSARDIWIELGKHFEKRSRMVSIDLRRRLQEVRCAEKGDVIAHFATLRTMREDLASMGETLSESDFYAIIMGSLPSSFDPYISAVSATSSVLGTHLSADDLMLTITEEYERRNLKTKSGKKDENVALYSNDSDKGNKGGSSSKKNVECYNCGKKGHVKKDCWAEGGGKAGQGPKQKGKGKGKGKEKEKEGKEKETAAATKETKEEKPKDEEAWMVMIDDCGSECNSSDDASGDFDIDILDEIISEDACSSFEELDELTDSPSTLDFFDISEPSDGNVLDAGAYLIDDEVACTSFDAASLAGAGMRGTEVDLYDSGATRHMSGFRYKFLDFVPIDPVPIITADKRSFEATGKGNMYVYLPNKNQPNSRILLKDVLYASAMGITLVSISRIAGAGSTVVFTGNICRIYTKNREVVGEIKVKGGLYRVFGSDSKTVAHAASVKEPMSINELHRRLGHVSHDRARLLVKKGLVKGIELEEDGDVVICESCEWAKGQRKAVTKIREEDRRTAVGDEIHSDLWGPAPVESINRKKYYVTFTDDYSRYTNIYFLHSKDETFDFYQAYEAWLFTQYKVRIKCLRSDRGGEYLDDDFVKHLRKTGFAS